MPVKVTSLLYGFVIVLLVVVMGMMLMRQNNLNNFDPDNEESFSLGEDRYQKDCAIDKNKNSHSNIYCVVTFDKDLKCIKYIVDKTLEFAYEFFAKDYPAVYRKMMDNDYKVVEKTDDVYEAWKNEDKYPVQVLKLLYSYPQRKLMMIMDHIYIGGYWFMEWGCRVFDGDYVEPYELNYQPVLTELNSLRFILNYYLGRVVGENSGLRLFGDRESVRRFVIRKHVRDLEEPNTGHVSTKVRIAWDIMKIIKPNLSVNRDIYFLMPIAFKSDKYGFNNVGAIMSSMSDDDDLESFNKRIMSRKYQAGATNHLMQLVNRGKEARQKIDAILTIGFVKNPKLITPEDLSKVEVSYADIGHYGIYCACFTYGDILHMSFTVMTPDFKMEQMKQYAPDGGCMMADVC